MTLPRIFVHIPAYRDRECQWTLRDMFERARHPERVFAGVCWQVVPEEDADCFLIRPRPAQVRAVEHHVREAQGLGWARAKAQALWQGEEYSLQIDSHMRFADDWDVAMLEMLAECPSDAPVLTAYPPSYVPPDKRTDADHPGVQTMRKFQPGGMLEFGYETVPPGVTVSAPLPTAAVAGGFIFGSARILEEIPSDPQIYFSGEEPSLALRLWTSGFDLFSPHRTVIYHYYLRRDGSRHWNDAPSREQLDLSARTERRMRLLSEPERFTPDEVAALGRYGLGTRRTLQDYEAFAGVDFSARSISSDARVYPFVRQAEPDSVELPPPPRLKSGARLFLLGDEGVLFNEAGGRVHHLNRGAARVWCALEAGWSWRQIATEAAAHRKVAPALIAAELCELAAHWRAEGLLRGAATAGPLGPRLERMRFTARDYRLLDTVVRLHLGEEALGALVHPPLAHLEVADLSPAEELTIFRLLDWTYVFDGDQPRALLDTPAKLVPTLKAEIAGRAIDRHHHVLHLHAAAVAIGEALVLLPGPSGAGKTVLAARLLAHGATYFSDESVLLRRDGTVRPVPTAVSIKQGAVPLLAGQFSGLAALPEHERSDGVHVRYLSPPRATQPRPALALRPRVIAFPRFVKGAVLSVQPLSAAQAIRKFFAECIAVPHHLDAEAMAMIVQAVEAASCWELSGEDLEGAAQAVVKLAAQKGAQSL